MNWTHILIRWVISAAAILATTFIVPGVDIEGSNGFLVALAVALILGLVNAIIRPILVLLSCGCIVATLGLFLLVVNALTLLIAGWFSRQVGIGFYVDGFVPALIGSIIISIITWLLSMFIIGDRER